MQKTQNNFFINEEVKSKIELDLKEKTQLIWDIPSHLENMEDWFQIGFQTLESSKLKLFSPFIENANFLMSIWSKPNERGFAVKYNVDYNLKSSGKNGMSITFFYDNNGNFKKQYNW